MRSLLHSTSRSAGQVARWAHRPLTACTLIVFALAACALASGVLSPQYATAEATPGPAPVAGVAGLPDGRIYEQVSPQLKPGSEAGSPLNLAVWVGAGGNEVAFETDGPMGEAVSGLDLYSIARRSSAGWVTRSAIPRAPEKLGANGNDVKPIQGLGFSADMASTVFGSPSAYVKELQEAKFATGLGGLPSLAVYNPEDGVSRWIGKPMIANPIEFAGTIEEVGEDVADLTGASPDFSTIYFSWAGALVPEDEVPDPTLGNISYAQTVKEHNEGKRNTGFVDSYYEWHEGDLKAVGVLPDGHLDPDGAAPAVGAGTRRNDIAGLGNEVSEDGRVAFFVSPAPSSESGRPSELYARVTAPDGTQSTELVSRDELLPDVNGMPAPAPGGVRSQSFNDAEISEADIGYAYASSDGSRVFFGSTDQLTASAPSGATPKAYEFDVATESLIYLPGIAPTDVIFASSRDASRFLFEQREQSGLELELWNEGTVIPIAPIDSGSVIARATGSGSEFVFQAKAAFPQFNFNNGNGEYREIYRYDTATNTLSCVSCPPTGITPTGGATMAHEPAQWNQLTGVRGITEDGKRVFFDSPDPLVPQDTDGVYDVYEWEEGVLYLISSGTSQDGSYFGDNSPSGDDVAFSTAEGLVPGDVDGSYDVYDARVPRPGDQQPPKAIPCEGAVCQGPPSVPQLFSPPGSETFNGAENLPSASVARSEPKSSKRSKGLARALRACRSKRDKRRRSRCEQRAWRAHKAPVSMGRQSRYQGRGK